MKDNGPIPDQSVEKEGAQRIYGGGEKTEEWRFVTQQSEKKAILERLVRAKRNVNLHLGGTVCKGKVRSMETKQPVC